jgi:UDP-2,4-diacetamido-2,4,6-trideoxy-beta-L-altropyranose hydrolase
MRCLTLAYKLRDKGVEVLFICKKFQGNSISFIRNKGFTVLTIPCSENNSSKPRELGGTQELDAKLSIDLLYKIGYKIVDWVIVDHYELDIKWHEILRIATKKILIIDDLANRQYDCDAILDQTLGRSESEYQRLVPKECQILTGTKYTLLRDEFSVGKDKIFQLRKCKEDSEIKKLLIMMGGTDPNNFTGKILNEMCMSGTFSHISIVLAANAPHLEAVKELCSRNKNIDLIVDSESVSKILLDSDVCIGAAGTSAWERCSLGLPSILFVLADNQKKIANELEMSGAAITFSHLRCTKDIKIELDKIVEKDRYQTMVNNCLNICDGQGVSRIFNKVFEC